MTEARKRGGIQLIPTDPQARRVEIVVDSPVQVGRSPRSDIVFDHPSVSTHHAVFHCKAGRLMVTDMNSMNGTFVNGVGVSGTVALRTDDILRFGTDRALRLVLPQGNIENSDTVGESTTDALELDVLPYTLSCSLQAGPGPLAELQGEDGRRHRVRAANRCTLLYVLAQQLQEDRRTEKPSRLVGWVEDEQLRRLVWGPQAQRMYPNNLQVLIRRVRKELGEAGFDGWCLQKHNGHTRLAIRKVEIQD